jgi:rubrerythrin
MKGGSVTAISCTSTEDVVRFAIEKEEKSMAFYQKCADRARNSGIKKFFEDMVREERKHCDLLKGLDAERLREVKLEKVMDLHISDYLMDVPFREDLTYQEALTLAMKKEEKAHAFYASWQNRCLHKKTESLFQLLAQEERKHKQQLEKMYDDEVLTWD